MAPEQNKGATKGLRVRNFIVPAFEVLTCLHYTVCGKYLEGENIGEFGDFVAIRQTFTLQMP